MPLRPGAAFVLALFCALALPASPQLKLGLSPTRHAVDDLEVTGMASGLQPGAVAYVSYADLAKLPQITTTIQNDSNFADQLSRGVKITGIPLDELAKALGVLPGSDLIDALCTDHYRSHYPADYIAAHHPIFALKINGQRPAAWAKLTKEYNPGPYFITHANYVPRYSVLSHQEQAQIPDNIQRINFSTVAATYGPLTPHGSYPPDSPVTQGLTIAKQNCLRCHFVNNVGGYKSGRDWRILALLSREQPQYFERYIHNPQSVDSHAHMEGNLGYDPATLAALTSYFQTYTEGTTKK